MASAVAIVLLVILGALMVWGIIERKKVEKWLKKKWDEYFGDSPAPVPVQVPVPAPGPGPTPSPSPSPAEEEEDTVQQVTGSTTDGSGYMIESYNIKK